MIIKHGDGEILNIIRASDDIDEETKKKLKKAKKEVEENSQEVESK